MMAGLGLDVDTAIDVADNALTHNCIPTLLKLAGKLFCKEGAKKVAKEGVKKATKPVNVEKLADKVAKNLGGVKTPAKGDGYKILIPNKKNPITVRVMEKGGQRGEAYYRISMGDKGTVNKIGEFCSDPIKTHMEINGNSLADIISAVNKIKG